MIFPHFIAIFFLHFPAFQRSSRRPSAASSATAPCSPLPTGSPPSWTTTAWLCCRRAMCASSTRPKPCWPTRTRCSQQWPPQKRKMANERMEFQKMLKIYLSFSQRNRKNSQKAVVSKNLLLNLKALFSFLKCILQTKNCHKIPFLKILQDVVDLFSILKIMVYKTAFSSI